MFAAYLSAALEQHCRMMVKKCRQIKGWNLSRHVAPERSLGPGLVVEMPFATLLSNSNAEF